MFFMSFMFFSYWKVKLFICRLQILLFHSNGLAPKMTKFQACCRYLKTWSKPHNILLRKACVCCVVFIYVIGNVSGILKRGSLTSGTGPGDPSFTSALY